jgi:DNA topoisomerase I
MSVSRLRTVSPDQPGISRRRSGRGFSYRYPDGRVVSAEDRERIKALVIPPAWRDVWICSAPNGHIQAVGTDDAGRRQYLYHADWREQRDQIKFDHVLAVAQRLPAARRTVTRHLQLRGLPRERTLAAAFRLLDLGLFRIGGETYAEENDSYGLATLRRRHVTVSGSTMTFRYPAKSGQRREVEITDEATARVVRALLGRTGGGRELLAYQDGRGWRDVTSTQINDYVKERLGEDVSAKDFRTWHATVLAAAELAMRADHAESNRATEKAIREMVQAVAEQLGNTPTIARKSYVAPGVVDEFRRGNTVDVAAHAHRLLARPSVRSKAERATRELLTEIAGR